MSSKLLAAILSVLAAFILLFGTLALARRRDNYQHVHSTISELGEVGATDAKLAAFGVFLPVSLLLFVVASMFPGSDIRVSVLAIAIATGYLVAVFSPCDPGSPMIGSNRQFVHNIGGMIEYLGGTMALWAIGEKYGALFVASGWIGALGTLAISIPGMRFRGLVQRVMESGLFFCLVYACLLSRN